MIARNRVIGPRAQITKGQITGGRSEYGCHVWVYERKCRSRAIIERKMTYAEIVIERTGV